jgi:sec-independent protein translocase protein TatA
MLGLDNPIHIAFVLVLVLLVFGAKRLPEMGKSLGAGMRGFKDSLTGEEPMTSLQADHTPQRVDDLSTSRTTVVEPVEPVVEPMVDHTPAQPVA